MQLTNGYEQDKLSSKLTSYSVFIQLIGKVTGEVEVGLNRTSIVKHQTYFFSSLYKIICFQLKNSIDTRLIIDISH